MRVPRFSAEASLYESPQSYDMVSTVEPVEVLTKLLNE